MLKENYSKDVSISVITVCLNSCLSITETFESILNQTLSEFEYIVIDGGSIDGTLDIIRTYRQKFLNKGLSFNFISEKDSGIYYAMNKGIELAKGNWIGILNSDDTYEIDALENIEGFINSNREVELVYGKMSVIDKNNNKLYLNQKKKISEISNDMCFFHPTIFIKTTIYFNHGFYNTRYSIVADWELLKRFYNKKINFGYIDKYISCFRLGGISSKYSYKYLKERILVRHIGAKWDSLFYDINDAIRFFIKFF